MLSLLLLVPQATNCLVLRSTWQVTIHDDDCDDDDDDDHDIDEDDDDGDTLISNLLSKSGNLVLPPERVMLAASSARTSNSFIFDWHFVTESGGFRESES